MLLKVNTIQEYWHTLPEKELALAMLLSKHILAMDPSIQESISYGMPAYKIGKKVILYFAVYAKHIGIYALPHTHVHFAEELKTFKQGKGSVQFPLDKDLPLQLILAMAKHNLNTTK
jgi:uncharacterized protein YdhG (YjbR/CyaY superfamily)